jgi:hypothetical protein
VTTFKRVRTYDSTVARIAGNIASGMTSANPAVIARRSVELAILIIAEVERQSRPDGNAEGEAAEEALEQFREADAVARVEEAFGPGPRDAEETSSRGDSGG